MLTANDRSEMRYLADRYALAIDELNIELLKSCFSEDIVLDYKTGRIYRGKAELSKLLENVRSRFVNTFHAVLNQVVIESAGGVEGETYCIARHLVPVNQGVTCYEMTIRYRDSFVREAGTWVFRRRELKCLWTTTHSVHPGRETFFDADLRSYSDLDLAVA